MQDGIAENQTAAMLDPCLNPVRCDGHDHGPGDGHGARARGRSHIDPDALRAYVTASWTS